VPRDIIGNNLLPRLSEWQQTGEKTRVPGTREGVNGMLDYDTPFYGRRFALARRAWIHCGHWHCPTPKAGSFALADDVMNLCARGLTAN